MKKFIRTIPGKAILFLGVIVSLCILAGCVLGADAIADAGFYDYPEEMVISSRMEEMVREDINSIAWEIYDSGANSRQTYESPADRTNLRYGVYDESGRFVARTRGIDCSPDDAGWEYCYYYLLSGSSGEFIMWDRMPSEEEIKSIGMAETGPVYRICASLDRELPAKDIYAQTVKTIKLGYRFRYAVYFIGAAALLFTVLFFAALMCVSGRRPGTEELMPGPLGRVPFDLLAAAVCFTGVLGGCVQDYFGYRGIGGVICCIILWITFLCIAVGFAMSIAARIKQRTIFTNTVIWRLVRWLRALPGRAGRRLKPVWRKMKILARGIPMIWKTALVLAGLSLLELLMIVAARADKYLLFWVLEKLILIPAVLFAALQLRKLQDGGRALAAGNLSYQVDTEGMFWDFRDHGENLNSIAEGMALAVEEKMKSERMKTELITNVSHDIKTPLTSIINYANLIGKEPCENAAVTEYAEVLVRQSERLKRLIEDLVEASKAATGNLEVLLAPCEAEIFVTQISGEYEQKLKAEGLELVTRQPEESVRVMADGRRMLRVFDNLMNNICKYSQQGTRVYLSLEKRNDQAVITFKNISKAALNLSAEELMERFVRGDSSRNTEGNGLGLSIAKSLTELQNGTMELAIDGDLFKATLRFPIVRSEEEEIFGCR
ncbi:sensor histidine kinase [Fusibacillus kribbianus]|uniref:histidine kinase n=1 Tax=Fusibacillus kribbianus TaxID=3044208 RepID=A0AAP4EXS9_9FIRM|nr:HAMP domain-containing sensor histidine kinase [Ruminococcus sp. YH-rum2234]MDI9241166.1 HAMP domain-containing sensor histidine kinase [Ruminococcus sp. YH-rum2234]